MISVIVSPQARADIAGIIDHFSTVASVATAIRWSNRLWIMVDDIAAFPGSGAPRPRLGANVRIKIVAAYIMIYEYERGAAPAGSARGEARCRIP